MSFISFAFAFFFFIFVILYHLAAQFSKHASLVQRVLLLAGSFVFYAFADLRFAPFLLYVIALSYCAGRFCKSKSAFCAFIAADLLPLLFFKYSPTHWIFPLGISFFTFQSISYIADVFTKKISAERGLLNVALFISFFPTISSGPIQRANTLIPQFSEVHHFDYDFATDGMKLFVWGILKKLYIADKIAVYVNYVYGAMSKQYGPALLLATALYSFQIYCDFSGYSDMAIGVARYLGFDIGKNFDHPYLSKSVGEFWRRWHISLSSWLRDYIYIPLGGSRVALPRIYCNLLITFLISGIWHGSSWNFVLWGLLHGLYLCAERATKPFWEKRRIPFVIKIIITFCLVTFAWIFFRTKNLREAGIVINKIAQTPKNIMQFSTIKNALGTKAAVKILFALDGDVFGGLSQMAKLFATLILFALISVTTRKTPGLTIIKNTPLVLRWILYIAIFLMLSLMLDVNTNTEFLYFAF